MQQDTPAPEGASPILCRFMREEDVPACAAIEAKVDDGWTEAALRTELAQESARLFVAEVGGEIAALAAFQLVCGEASLYAVSTAPAFRRQGVARALLSWAFAALCLQDAQTVFLRCAHKTKPRGHCIARSALRKRACAKAFTQSPPTTPC